MMIEVNIKNTKIYLNTDSRLFSPKTPDQGTLIMLSHVDFQQDDQVLDLGCGYGIVGIYAAAIIPPDQVYMSDIDPAAVEISSENVIMNGVSGVTILQSDAYAAIEKSNFTLILSNPPYHTDFSVAKTFIEKGFNRLAIGGRMYMVTKRKDWYKNKLISVFGGVHIWEENGYFIFMAQKKTGNYANANPHKNNNKGEGKKNSIIQTDNC